MTQLQLKPQRSSSLPLRSSESSLLPSTNGRVKGKICAPYKHKLSTDITRAILHTQTSTTAYLLVPSSPPRIPPPNNHRLPSRFSRPPTCLCPWGYIPSRSLTQPRPCGRLRGLRITPSTLTSALPGRCLPHLKMAHVPAVSSSVRLWAPPLLHPSKPCLSSCTERSPRTFKHARP